MSVMAAKTAVTASQKVVFGEIAADFGCLDCFEVMVKSKPDVSWRRLEGFKYVATCFVTHRVLHPVRSRGELY
jgi:hypothetical protein